jgi:nucleoside-diphosphate-sugar epimerase
MVHSRVPRLLVTGATGAIGPAVVRASLAAGHDVRALVRGDAPADALPGVEWCKGDLLEPASLVAAVRQVDAVVHLAALLHITNPPPALQREYERVNVDGTAHLLAAARAAGVPRFVLASTTAVYGDTHGQVADEGTAPRPDTWYAASKLRAEQLVLDAVGGSRPEGVVLRFSAAYGPRVKGNYRRLVIALARRRFVGVGAGSNRRSLIHEDDVGAAVMRAATHDTGGGRLYNVADGSPHRVRDIIEAISRALGRPAPRFSVPAPVARTAARAVDAASTLLGRPLGLAGALQKYLEDSAVDATRIRTELGFEPRVTLERGWALTIAAMREAGDLPADSTR